MPKRPRYDPADDEPKTGDIWCLRLVYVSERYYYLLCEQIDQHTFVMICLNSGESRDVYMNFDLDDWRWVA